MTRYKFKIGDEVYFNDGWRPPFKFTILHRLKHFGSNMYVLSKNEDWIEAQYSIHGTSKPHDYAHRTPIYEDFLSNSTPSKETNDKK